MHTCSCCTAGPRLVVFTGGPGSGKRFRYHRTVFVAPPWPEIYENDTERKQTREEAERTYASVSSAYLDYGYELVELPRVPVEERVAFVLRHLRRA